MTTKVRQSDLVGLRHVARFVKSAQEPRDFWLLHEVGGKPLSK